VLAALYAFAQAGVRPRSPLARAIVALLWFKLVIVVALSVYLHVAGAAPPTASQTLDRLLDPTRTP
jgi:hypothetical protein